MHRLHIANSYRIPGRMTGLVWTAIVIAALSAKSDGLMSSSLLFYDDDPVAREVDTKNASDVQERKINLIYHQSKHLFATPGDTEDRRALNVNTIDEVPDSSWFVDRILARNGPSVTVRDVARGPGAGVGPAPGRWIVLSSKRQGITPGFTVLDANRDRWVIKVDPPSNPEMASGAEVVVTKLFHAIGYHVPENAIAEMRRDNLVLTNESTTIGMNGSERRMREDDLDAMLRGAARRPDGSFRVLASRLLPGRPLGGFYYYGTRPDDPNDVVPHEHRRELRGLGVFAAWVNHHDVIAINTLDTLIPEGDRRVVRHHLIDFGSTLGSAAVRPRRFDHGHQYAVEPRSLLTNALSLGLHVRPFERVRYRDLPSVGRFSADRFDPVRWKPEVPNPAFLRARADDLFWGARRVMAFTDEMISAAVSSASYSDERAARHITETLVARRDLIGRAWLTSVNPIVDPSFDGKVLLFKNAAVDAGVAAAPAGYVVSWKRFDNATGATTDLGTTKAADASTAAPADLPTGAGSYIRLEIAATGGPESWAEPVHAYFRRQLDGWKFVGFERMPGDSPLTSNGVTARR
jgi:hypothetical protein